MAGQTEIANMAFRLLGANRITSFTQDVPGAKLAQDTYTEYLDAFLTLHPWKFATLQDTLAADGTAPVWGWTYSYPLPVEPTFALRALYVNGEGIESGRWQPREHSIVTDLGTPIEITFIYRSTAYGYWGGPAIDAFSSMLAMNWAMPVTQDIGLMNAMEARYEKNLRRARAANGSQGSQPVLQTTSWLNARTIGGADGTGQKLVEPA